MDLSLCVCNGNEYKKIESFSEIENQLDEIITKEGSFFVGIDETQVVSGRTLCFLIERSPLDIVQNINNDYDFRKVLVSYLFDDNLFDKVLKILLENSTTEKLESKTTVHSESDKTTFYFTSLDVHCFNVHDKRIFSCWYTLKNIVQNQNYGLLE